MAKKRKADLPIIKEVRDLLRVAPFTGLVLRTSDGQSIRVIHQDYIFIAPNHETLHVYDEDQHLHIINGRQLVSVTPARSKKAS